MLEHITQHMKRLGPQGDRQTCPVQRIELGIEETIGEDIAHGAILRSSATLVTLAVRMKPGSESLENFGNPTLEAGHHVLTRQHVIRI
jgi:hypothetical protein